MFTVICLRYVVELFNTILSDSFVTMYFTKNIQLSNVPRAENGKENKITMKITSFMGRGLYGGSPA